MTGRETDLGGRREGLVMGLSPGTATMFVIVAGLAVAAVLLLLGYSRFGWVTAILVVLTCGMASILGTNVRQRSDRRELAIRARGDTPEYRRWAFDQIRMAYPPLAMLRMRGVITAIALVASIAAAVAAGYITGESVWDSVVVGLTCTGSAMLCWLIATHSRTGIEDMMVAAEMPGSGGPM
jgi:hypothetical protein